MPAATAPPLSSNEASATLESVAGAAESSPAKAGAQSAVDVATATPAIHLRILISLQRWASCPYPSGSKGRSSEAASVECASQALQQQALADQCRSRNAEEEFKCQRPGANGRAWPPTGGRRCSYHVG